MNVLTLYNIDNNWLIVTVLFLTGAGIAVAMMIRRRIADKLTESMMAESSGEENDEQEGEKDHTDIKEGGPVTMAERTSAKLLRKLQKFEENEGYLKKGLDLGGLASQFGTNSKYLSETIKTHSGKSFSDYINGLRISYIVDCLEQSSAYRLYKTEYLARVCGYASRSVFATAFKRETGKSPSNFIQEIKERLEAEEQKDLEQQK